jgi:hypothetical protein
MGQARVFIPILALARIRPMVRTSVLPPIPPHVVGLRSEDRLEPRALGGFRPIAGLALSGQRLGPRWPVRWMRRVSPRARSLASISSER